MIFSSTTTSRYHCTLREPVHYPGTARRGANEPSLTLLPAEPGSGISFRRSDIEPQRALIRASWRNAIPTEFGTMLVNDAGIPVNRVELVMAAVRGCGIDNLIIETGGSGLPEFDGSAAPLVALINRAGVAPQNLSRPAIWIERTIEVRRGDSYAMVNPADLPRITVNLEPAHPLFESQCVSREMVDHVFARDIAPARNPALFGAGIDATGIGAPMGPQSEPRAVDSSVLPRQARLRFDDEPARYRLLESYGILALAGDPIFGHVFANRPTADLMHALVREIYQHRHYWTRLSYESIEHRFDRDLTSLSAPSTRLH